MIYVLCESYREFLAEVHRRLPDGNPMRDAKFVRWPHDLSGVVVRPEDEVVTLDSWSNLPGRLRAQVGLALSDATGRHRS